MSTATGTGLDAVLEIYDQWKNQNDVIFNLQKDIDAAGTNISNLNNSIANAGGNEQAIHDYGVQIDQMNNWRKESTAKIIAAKAFRDELWTNYLSAKAAMSPAEATASVAVLNAQAATIIDTIKKEKEEAEARAKAEATAPTAGSTPTPEKETNFAAGNTKYFLIGGVIVLIIAIAWFASRKKNKGAKAAVA